MSIRSLRSYADEEQKRKLRESVIEIIGSTLKKAGLYRGERSKDELKHRINSLGGSKYDNLTKSLIRYVIEEDLIGPLSEEIGESKEVVRKTLAMHTLGASVFWGGKTPPEVAIKLIREDDELLSEILEEKRPVRGLRS